MQNGNLFERYAKMQLILFKGKQKSPIRQTISIERVIIGRKNVGVDGKLVNFEKLFTKPNMLRL